MPPPSTSPRVVPLAPGELVEVLAEAYAEAARREAPMRLAVEALEAIRDAVASGDGFRLWWVIQDQIGRAHGSTLQPPLLNLRERLAGPLTAAYRSLIQRKLEESGEAGWALWLEIFAAALAHWRVTYLSTVAGFDLPAPPEAQPPLQELRSGAYLAAQERWPEVYDLIVRISERLENPSLRARLQVVAGQIQLFRFRRFAKAREHLDRALELAPQDPAVIGVLGQWWEESGHRPRAKAEFYQREIALGPDLAGGYSDMASALLAEEDLNGAEAHFQQAILRSPGEVRGYSGLIALYSRPELYPIRAETIAGLRQRLLVLVPEEEIYTVLNEADNHRLNGRYDQARTEYDRALGLEPDRLRAVIGRGLCAANQAATLKGEDPRRQELHEEAASYFRQAISLAPHAPDGYWVLSFLAETEGRTEEALEICRQAMARHADWAPAMLVRMGSLECARRRYAEAESYLRQAFELDPGNRDALSVATQLGDDLLYVAGDREGAQRLYELVRDADSLQPDVYLNRMGNLRYYEKDYGSAADYYRQAIAARPDDPGLYGNLAGALLASSASDKHLAELEEAVALLRQAAALSPSPEYRQRLAQAESQRDFWTRYGAEAAAWSLTLPPIRVLLDASLLPLILDESRSALNQDIRQMTSELRARLGERFGILLPGVNFTELSDAGAPAGTYRLELNGESEAAGQIDVQAPDVLPRLLAAVEGQLTRAMARILSVDVMAERLQRCAAKECMEILNDMRRLVRFTFVARDLVGAGRSLADGLETLAARFCELDTEAVSVGGLTEQLRAAEAMS